MDRDYEELVRPLERRLIRAVWRVLRHEADADDALQDGLTRVWRRLDQVRRHPNPEALVVRICLNAAHDVLRRRRRRGQSEVVLGTIELSADVPSAPERVEAEELHAELRSARRRSPLPMRNMSTTRRSSIPAARPGSSTCRRFRLATRRTRSSSWSSCRARRESSSRSSSRWP